MDKELAIDLSTYLKVVEAEIKRGGSTDLISAILKAMLQRIEKDN